MLTIVPTSNFKFLEQKLPELAALGNLAEDYVFADPTSSAVKLRLFSEKLVDIIYTIHNLRVDIEEINLFNKLNSSEFMNIVPVAIINTLHFLRSNGNKAAHGSQLSSQTAINLLTNAHQLAKWIFAAYCAGNIDSVPAFLKTLKNQNPMMISLRF